VRGRNSKIFTGAGEDKKELKQKLEHMRRVLLISLVIAVAGCTSTGPGMKTYGNQTQVAYQNSIGVEKVRTVHDSVQKVGWNGNVTLEKLNSTTYRVNVTTNRPDEALTVPERYQVQRTITMIKSGGFQNSETVILHLKSRNGRLLSKFVQ
jgi:hypothetical protein